MSFSKGQRLSPLSFGTGVIYHVLFNFKICTNHQNSSSLQNRLYHNKKNLSINDEVCDQMDPSLYRTLNQHCTFPLPIVLLPHPSFVIPLPRLLYFPLPSFVPPPTVLWFPLFSFVLPPPQFCDFPSPVLWFPLSIFVLLPPSLILCFPLPKLGTPFPLFHLHHTLFCAAPSQFRSSLRLFSSR